MAANYTWNEANGVGEAVTVDIANLNFGSVDDHELTPIDHPIIAAQNSYGKYIKGAFSGSFTRIDNIKFWKASGSYVAGESCQFSGSVAYAQPVATDYSDPAVPTSEPANPNVGISGDVDGNIDGPCDDGSSCDTDYMRVQLLTTGATPGGSVNQKTFVLQYEEQ